MNEQLINLISHIKNPTMIVFWVETTTKGNIYHHLSMKIREQDNEMKAFFNDKSNKYIDLYGVDFNDIKVFKTVDWII